VQNLIVRAVWLSVFAGALLPSFAQTIEWTRQFGTTGTDNGFAVATAPNALYVAGGAVNGAFPGSTAAGRNDAFVARLALDGTVVWARQFGTSEGDEAVGVAADASGVYVVGYTGGGLQGANAGGSDAFIRKYDPDGNVLWTRQFGGSGGADDRATAAAVDSTGLYVGGSVAGALPGQAGSGVNLDAFVRKYDFAGNETWTRQFGTIDLERTYGVALHASGVYVTGETGGALATQVGGLDYFVRKLDASGNTVWTRQFGTSTTDGGGYGGAVAVNDSGVYIVGHTTGTFPGQNKVGGLWDDFIQKYDLNGNAQWVRQFGTSLEDGAYGVAVDTQLVYIAGQAGSGAFLWRFDADGNDRGNIQRGTFNTFAQGVATDASGAYVTGGTSGVQFGQQPVGDQDVFVFKVPHPPLLSGVAEAFNGQVGSAQSTWTALYGSNLARAVRTWDGAIVGTQLPLSLDGVTVSINGKPAPIYFVSPNQVNVLAPLDDLTGNVQITLNNVNGASRALTIRKAEVLPAFYAPFADGNKLMVTAVALDGTLVGKAGVDPRVTRGGRSGEIIQFFATGFGKTNPSVPADQLFAGVPELVTAPRVTIGGKEAALLGKGNLVSPGLYQFNLTIPDLAAGDHVIVAVIGTTSSPANVYFTVQ
jgi:uncharacterized protein (TIGR03437 family)